MFDCAQPPQQQFVFAERSRNRGDLRRLSCGHIVPRIRLPIFCMTRRTILSRQRLRQ